MCVNGKEEKVYYLNKYEKKEIIASDEKVIRT